MLRYLAALMVCMLVLAIQAGPAMAHNGDFTPSGTEIRLANAEFRASAAAQEDCPTDASCCKAICAPCFAPLCTYQGGTHHHRFLDHQIICAKANLPAVVHSWPRPSRTPKSNPLGGVPRLKPCRQIGSTLWFLEICRVRAHLIPGAKLRRRTGPHVRIDCLFG